MNIAISLNQKYFYYTYVIWSGNRYLHFKNLQDSMAA